MEKAAAAAAATVMSCTGSNGELSCAEPPVFSPFFPPSCKVGTHLAPILAAGSPAAARFLPPPFSLFLSLPLFFPPPPLPFFFPPSPLSRPQRPPPQALRACRVRRGGGGEGGRARGRAAAGGRTGSGFSMQHGSSSDMRNCNKKGMAAGRAWMHKDSTGRKAGLTGATPWPRCHARLAMGCAAAPAAPLPCWKRSRVADEQLAAARRAGSSHSDAAAGGDTGVGWWAACWACPLSTLT